MYLIASIAFIESTPSYFHNHSTNIHGSRGGGGGLKFNQKKNDANGTQ